MSSQQYDKALVDCDKAIELNPNMSRYYEARGKCRQFHDDFTRAIADFDKAIELDPNASWQYESRGRCHRSAGDLARAIADFDKALELEPSRTWLYAQRGLCLRGKGDLARAIADFDKAIKLNPNVAWMYVARSIVRRLQGDYVLAIDDCTSALRIDPEHLSAFHNRAIARRLLGHYNEAVEDTSAGLKTAPDNAALLHERALNYGHLGAHDKAIEDYRQAIESEPTNGWRWFKLLDLEFACGASQETTQKLLAGAEAASDHDLLVFQYAAWSLLLNRQAEYEKICREAASKCADSEMLREVELAARAAALTNEPVLPTEELVEMASRVVEAEPTPCREHALGLCLLRDGQAHAAIERFNSSLDEKSWKTGVQANWLGLAIAHAAEGRVREAQDWLSMAQEWFAQNPLDPASELHPVDRIECQVLLREAEQMLRKPEQETNAPADQHEGNDTAAEVRIEAIDKPD
jgi:tetratricopeptide (TPR) repeat protein